MDWTSCDRYFAAIMAETFPNRIYQHAAVTDRLTNTTTISTLPTIWDRLATRGLRGRYYYSDVPFLALWGSRYASIGRSYAQFLADCETGGLPEVSFVEPRFLGEEQGVSGDDHPHGDIRAGERFLYRTYRAITTSPAWPRTLLVINFDEWGGFFDDVAPAQAPDVDPAYRLRGFRTPALVISPFARRSFVPHDVYDHTSILRLIEWRWGLNPLGSRPQGAKPGRGSRALVAERRRSGLPGSASARRDPLCRACSQPGSRARGPRTAGAWLRLADLRLGPLLLRRSIRIPRQPVVRELLPVGAKVHEGVVLRPDLRVAVERAEPDRDLVPLRPVAAEEARSTDRAEDFRRATVGSVDPEQLLPREQPELPAGDAALRQAEGAGVLAAARAVTVARPTERQLDLEANAAAEAAPLQETGTRWPLWHAQ